MDSEKPHPKINLNDPSLWGVVFGNLISLYLATVQEWSLHQIMWVYWSQSVIIGVTNVIRILSLKEFSTTGLTMNDRAVPETQEAKNQVAWFFAFHYGFFHLGYAAFLWKQMPLSDVPIGDMALMMFAVSAFVGSHSYSLLHNMRMDFRQQKPNLGTLMFYPYLRIIPMHLTIFVGENYPSIGILSFMGLKTLADAGTHMVEHYLFQRRGKDYSV